MKSPQTSEGQLLMGAEKSHVVSLHLEEQAWRGWGGVATSSKGIASLDPGASHLVPIPALQGNLGVTI